jgi:hypothetical protein
MSKNSISVQGKTSLTLRIVAYDVDVQPGGGEEVQVPLPDVPHHDIRSSVLGSQLHRCLLPRNIPGVPKVMFVTVALTYFHIRVTFFCLDCCRILNSFLRCL